MLLIAFLAQNCAIGLNFGLYGTIVHAVQDQYGATRALAASGLAVMALVMGLLSPLMASLIGKFPLPALMVTGALLNAIGYMLLALSSDIRMFLAIYALVIGPGVCMLGIVPCSTLVSNWFVAGRGRALGFLNMPLFVSISPLMTAVIFERWGLQAVFVTAACIYLALLPLLLLVATRPADAGCDPYLGRDRQQFAAAAPDPAPPALTSRQILLHPAFQVIWIGVGFMTAGGVMMTAHLAPLGMEKGLGIGTASLMLSAFGLSASLGALGFGWLADRIGGRLAASVQSLGWIAPWTALMFIGADALMLILLSALIGLISGGTVGLLGVLANEWLGPSNFTRVIGYVYFYKVPFLFGAAPLAGMMFDLTGSYDASIILHIVSFACVGFIYLMYRPKKQGQI